MQGQPMHMHGMPPAQGYAHNGAPFGGHAAGPPGHFQGSGQEQQGNASSRSVFVGNIPYTASEDQLLEVFETAGPVHSLRLEKQDGQLKGFGFCEFRDVDSAERAIRNLNNYEMNGRMLRVDYASENLDKRSGGPSLAQLAGSGPSGQEGAGNAMEVDGRPRGAASGGPMDAIASTVNNMTATQMFEVMGQLRQIVQSNKEQAKQLLMRDPQLCGQFLRMQERLRMLGGISLPPPQPQSAPPPPAPAMPQPQGRHHPTPQPSAPLQPPPSSQPPPHMDPRTAPPHMDPRAAPPHMDPRAAPPHMDPRAAPPHMDPRQPPPSAPQPAPYHAQPPFPPDPRQPPPQPYGMLPQSFAPPPHVQPGGPPPDPRRNRGPPPQQALPPQAAPAAPYNQPAGPMQGQHHAAPPPQQQQQQQGGGAGAGAGGGGGLSQIIANLSEQQLTQLKMLMQLPPQKLDEMQISAHQRALIDKLREQFQGR